MCLSELPDSLALRQLSENIQFDKLEMEGLAAVVDGGRENDKERGLFERAK